MPGSNNCIFNNDASWQIPSFPPAQAQRRDTIYMWHGVTANLLHHYQGYYDLLNTAEQAKANRYFQTTDRQRYVIQHGVLQSLLGWYLNKPVFSNAYIYGPNGKPYLPEANAQSCFFNLSNSGGQFLVAIGNKELGVDIEYLKNGFAYQDIISQYFGAGEQTYIANAPDPLEAFFLLWTRKEALLKATGKGIDDNLTQLPALNGKYALPDNYNNTDWLTASFKTGDSSSIVSVTYPSCPMSLQLMYLGY